jgi:hypothetical protein
MDCGEGASCEHVANCFVLAVALNPPLATMRYEQVPTRQLCRDFRL